MQRLSPIEGCELIGLSLVKCSLGSKGTPEITSPQDRLSWFQFATRKPIKSNDTFNFGAVRLPQAEATA